MWIILTFAMLVLTLIVHRILIHIYPSQVFCFLCAGCPIGLIHTALSFLIFGFTEETFAAILVFAAICEFILNLFSLAANGVSVCVLEQLSKGPTDLHTLNSQYSTNAMVKRRINQLQTDSFLIKQDSKLQLSSKGQASVRIFLRLYNFFGHETVLNNLEMENISKEIA